MFDVCGHSIHVNKQPPPHPLSAHVAVLVVVCMSVTLGSEAGPLTGRSLHTGDTHTDSDANGFHMSSFSLMLVCVYVCVCVCQSLSPV